MRGIDSSLEILGGLLASAGDMPATNGQEQAAAWAVMGGFMLFFLIFAVVLFGLQIYSCIWAGSDAERRGKSGVLIGLLVFFTWPLGLLIWVVARPERQLPPPPPASPPPPPVPNANLGR
jgi:hypothetical protein